MRKSIVAVLGGAAFLTASVAGVGTAQAATDAPLKITSCSYGYFSVSDPSPDMKVEVTINKLGSVDKKVPSADQLAKLVKGDSMQLALPKDWVSVNVTVDGKVFDNASAARDLNSCPIEEEKTNNKTKNSKSGDSQTTCSRFKYQEQAQAEWNWYEKNRPGMSDLDNDKDGVACSHLPKDPKGTKYVYNKDPKKNLDDQNDPTGGDNDSNNSSNNPPKNVRVDSGEGSDTKNWNIIAAGAASILLGGFASGTALRRKPSKVKN